MVKDRAQDIIGKRAPLALFILLIAVLPLAISNAYFLSTMVIVGLYSMVAMGLILLTGYAGQISLGQAVFFGLGGYAAAVLTTRYDLSPWLAMLSAAILAAVVAALVGRPLFRVRGYTLAGVTFAMSIIFTSLVTNFEFTGQASGLADIPHLSLGGFVLKEDLHYYYLVWVAAILMLIFSLNLVGSRMGRALRSMHSLFGGSEEAAQSLGVDTTSYKSKVFIISAVYASIAGSIFAYYMTVVNPSPFDYWFSILVLIMAIVGGISSPWGAFWGAGLVVGGREILREFAPRVAGGATGAYELITFGIILIAVLLFLPQGLASLRRPRPSQARMNALPAHPDRLGAGGQTLQPIGHGHLLPSPRQSRLEGEAMPDDSRQPLLQLRGVSKTFGGLAALRDVSFDVPRHSIVGLIGPNGAGKTTLFNLITGFLRPCQGEIYFKDRRLDRLPPHAIAALGIARTFQNRQLFANMSVVANVMVGRHARTKAGFLGTGLSLPRARAEEQVIFEAAMTRLAAVGLEEKALAYPQSLSLGQQKLVALARAQAMEPEILLLDEPAGGLSASEIEELGRWILHTREGGVSILLVEHVMDLVMDIADWVVVLSHGQKIAEGTPAQMQADEQVIAAYLGGTIGGRELE